MKRTWKQIVVGVGMVMGTTGACLAAGGHHGGGHGGGNFKPNLGSSQIAQPRVQTVMNQGIKTKLPVNVVGTVPTKPVFPVHPVGPKKPPLGPIGPIGPIGPVSPVKPPIGPIGPIGPVGPVKPPKCPPICPPYNPPCSNGPKCGWWGGWCYNPCTPIFIPIGGFGYGGYGGGSTTIVNETIVVESPAQPAAVVNEVAPAAAVEPVKEEKLMQVPVGATLTLQGKELGDKPGQVLLQFEKFSFPAQVGEWK